MAIFFHPHAFPACTILAVLSVPIFVSTSLGQELEADSGLVPAALGIRTDRQGTSWNVEQNGTIGRIGSTMVNSGLALKIDEESFAGFQPLMTPDGKEFVIPGRPFSEYPGLQVQRRIRLLEDNGVLRYAEMLYNGSTDPISLTLSLNTNFSGNYQTFLSNRGRTEPVLLEEGETGIVVLPGVAQSSRAFLFTLSGEASPLKPTISAQNRYGLSFQFPIVLAPGETRIVLHQAAQVIIPQNFDRPNLIRLFRPYSFEETSGELPSEWQRYLANFGVGASPLSSGRRDFRGVESLAIDRGNRDILAVGEQTRLLGTATGGDAEIASAYGSATIPFERIAALEGTRSGKAHGSRIFLEDGQVFSGAMEVPGLKFTQTGGDAIPLQAEELDRLVFAEKGKSSEEISTEGFLLETFRGDRILVDPEGDWSLEGQTQWGRLTVPLGDILRLQPSPPRQNGHWAELSDGTRCLLFVVNEAVGLQSEIFGPIEVETVDFRSLHSLREDMQKPWVDEVGIRSIVSLFGAQRLVCDVGDSTLPMISDGLRVDVPTSKIRRIERIAGEKTAFLPEGKRDTSFQVERWDGGVLTGWIDLEVLSLRVRGRDWKIPLRDIVRLETPSPELTPESLEEISALVEQLGALEWSAREEATRELGAFGYLAGPVLRSKLRETSDPEVSRRIERILAGLN